MSFLALYRDLGPSADGHSRVLGTFASKEDALGCIRQDVLQYCYALHDASPRVEEDGAMTSVIVDSDNRLCDWELIVLD